MHINVCLYQEEVAVSLVWVAFVHGLLTHASVYEYQILTASSSFLDCKEQILAPSSSHIWCNTSHLIVF